MKSVRKGTAHAQPQPDICTQNDEGYRRESTERKLKGLSRGRLLQRETVGSLAEGGVPVPMLLWAVAENAVAPKEVGEASGLEETEKIPREIYR